MKLNEHTAISTPKLLLVPYSAHHVPTYHGWMQDPSLQLATASEPLSLDEEHAMQRSWRDDRDKLTFIVCQPVAEISGDAGKGGVKAGKHDGPERMLGDINLFLFEDEDENEDEDGTTERFSTAQAPAKLVGEIELMIAAPTHRNKGHGRAALRTFVNFVLAHWRLIASEYVGSTDAKLPELAYLRAKISEANERSLHLFASVGFVRAGEGANYFGEVELRLPPGTAWSHDEEKVLRYE